MAKTDTTKADTADLNAEGATLDLNAEGVQQDLNAEGAAPGPATTEDALNPDEGEEDTGESSHDEGPEYVVLKGNHIRHDGEIYRENMTIPVTGADAARLLKAGVIGDIEQLRQRVLSAQPSVSVTSE